MSKKKRNTLVRCSEGHSTYAGMWKCPACVEIELEGLKERIVELPKVVDSVIETHPFRVDKVATDVNALRAKLKALIGADDEG